MTDLELTRSVRELWALTSSSYFDLSILDSDPSTNSFACAVTSPFTNCVPQALGLRISHLGNLGTCLLRLTDCLGGLAL